MSLFSRLRFLILSSQSSLVSSELSLVSSKPSLLSSKSSLLFQPASISESGRSGKRIGAGVGFEIPKASSSIFGLQESHGEEADLLRVLMVL